MKRKGFLFLSALVLFFVLPLSAQASGTYYITELDCSITLPEGWEGDTRETVSRWDTAEGEFLQEMEEYSLYFYGQKEDGTYSVTLVAHVDDMQDFDLLTSEEKIEWEEVTREFFAELDSEVMEFEWLTQDQAVFLKTTVLDPATGNIELDYTTVYGGMQYVLMIETQDGSDATEVETVVDIMADSMLFNSDGYSIQPEYDDTDYSDYDYDYDYDYDSYYEEESGPLGFLGALVGRGAAIVAILMVVFLVSRMRAGAGRNFIWEKKDSFMDETKSATKTPHASNNLSGFLNTLEKLGATKDETKKTVTRPTASGTRHTANSGLNGLVDTSKYDYAQRLEDYGLESPALPLCRKCKKKAQKPSRYCAYCDAELPKT